MSWEATGAIAETIAAVGVIASLVYLGRQIHQSTETTQASNELEAARLWGEFHESVWSSPDVARLWDLGNVDWSRLPADDRRRYIWFIAHYFIIVEGLFRQYERGLLSRDSWQPYESIAVGMLRHPAIKEWWASGVTPYSKSFSDHIDDRASQSGAGAWEYSPLSDFGGPSVTA